MYLTTERNISTDTAPAPDSHILLLGDSIARDFRTGAGGGAMLDQIDQNGGPVAGTRLINAAFGGYKLLDQSGADRFLNFTDLAEAQGLTDAKAIMAAFPDADALVISLGPNDLGNVEPAPAAIAGYDAGKVEAGLQALITAIRTEYAAPTLPVLLMVPGRDRSLGTKAGAGQVWRAASLAVADDPDVYLIDYYDVDIEDSVHPSADGFQTLGFRVGRMLSAVLYGDPAASGPPRITSITKNSDISLRLNFFVPSGESLTQPTYPAAWRAIDDVTKSVLRIARLDWIDSNEADLIFHDGTANPIRLFAPYDLVDGYRHEGIIRTGEGGNDHEPGFVLESFEGVTP